MKKLILATLAVFTLGSGSVLAQTDAGVAVGGTAGGVSGAIAGGLVFGPIGAVIGGFTGAVIGASAVADTSVDYARLNPTEPVVIQGDIDVGYAVPDTIELHVIDGDPGHAYFYTNDRLYFVELEGRTVVYSPGIVVAAAN
ncbi:MULTISPECIES: DUF1236 domain-containing protein [unclassified Devosia]|uniref:DUF1236 domain-containing protein n=1 Tax=unclassified Devosia TaxID=196773 RepID=UPI00086BEA19|nr:MULTISPECIES: DUF1236 domain-containing protein [unclassified Devosia]MBN9364455.1 DUF1236 domain-containing protein [Devosia sp.]ODS97850.1 MAG: hypothetical protein ABS47_00305 [Devosia sp. SCN 66-27]OJX20763.1 MAG: hypothetical protein BGO83_04295 [Devosia sp. 66-14]